jgi:hypothetical protein
MAHVNHFVRRKPEHQAKRVGDISRPNVTIEFGSYFDEGEVWFHFESPQQVLEMAAQLNAIADRAAIDIAEAAKQTPAEMMDDPRR